MGKRADMRRAKAIGKTVDFPGYGPVVITRWSGHAESFPIGRLARDPKYFGALLFANEDCRQAALAAGTMK